MWSKGKLYLRVNYFRGANGEREKHTELSNESLTEYLKTILIIFYMEKSLLLFTSLNKYM